MDRQRVQHLIGDHGAVNRLGERIQPFDAPGVHAGVACNRRALPFAQIR